MDFIFVEIDCLDNGLIIDETYWNSWEWVVCKDDIWLHQIEQFTRLDGADLILFEKLAYAIGVIGDRLDIFDKGRNLFYLIVVDQQFLNVAQLGKLRDKLLNLVITDIKLNQIIQLDDYGRNGVNLIIVYCQLGNQLHVEDKTGNLSQLIIIQ